MINWLRASTKGGTPDSKYSVPKDATPSWSSDLQAIVHQIRDKWHQSGWSEEEIFRVEGILDVNTLELLDFDEAEASFQDWRRG